MGAAVGAAVGAAALEKLVMQCPAIVSLRCRLAVGAAVGAAVTKTSVWVFVGVAVGAAVGAAKKISGLPGALRAVHIFKRRSAS